MMSLIDFARACKRGPTLLRRHWVLVNSLRLCRRAILKGNVPSNKLLGRLIYGWGNEAWAPDPSFLAAMVREALAARGPILECGTGLSTLLLGITAERTGNAIFSLEHDEFWQRFVAQRLQRFKITANRVLLAPLKSFGDYSWYSVNELVLPESLVLVICDGPPGSTPGGRYGLVPVVHEKLRSDSRILLDDADRSDEKAILDRWRREAKPALQILSQVDRYAILEVT